MSLNASFLSLALDKIPSDVVVRPIFLIHPAHLEIVKVLCQEKLSRISLFVITMWLITSQRLKMTDCDLHTCLGNWDPDLNIFVPLSNAHFLTASSPSISSYIVLATQ